MVKGGIYNQGTSSVIPAASVVSPDITDPNSSTTDGVVTEVQITGGNTDEKGVTTGGVASGGKITNGTTRSVAGITTGALAVTTGGTWSGVSITGGTTVKAVLDADGKVTTASNTSQGEKGVVAYTSMNGGTTKGGTTVNPTIPASPTGPIELSTPDCWTSISVQTSYQKAVTKFDEQNTSGKHYLYVYFV